MDNHNYTSENPQKNAYDISDKKRMAAVREKTDYTTSAKMGINTKNMPSTQNNTRQSKQAFLSSNSMWNGSDSQ